MSRHQRLDYVQHGKNISQKVERVERETGQYCELIPDWGQFAMELGDRDAVIGQYAIDLSLQTAWMWSNQATNSFTIFKNHQCWNCLDAQATGSFAMLVDIHFSKAEFAFVLSTQALKNRGNIATGTTPGSPEVDDHRGRSFQHFCFKILITDMKQICICSHKSKLSFIFPNK